MLTFIISVSVALVVSCTCSLLEAALLSITPSQLAQLRRANPSVGDLCRKLKYEINDSIAAILIGNTAAHTIGAAVAGSSFDDTFGSQWLGLFTLIFTLVMVQYTEILPKTLGVRYNIQVMRSVAHPLHITVILFKPLIRLTHFLNRPFERRYDNTQVTAAEEISALAALARSSQQISSRQERIINAVPLLSKRTAAQIMLPCENISFLSTNQSLSDAINCTGTEFHTRYPVCESGDRDRVAGYVNFKEVVATYRNSPDKKLTDILRPISVAEPNIASAVLLERFVSQHCHMAIVRSETGKTLGLITLEDIVEELLGDLDDEFDPLPRTFYAPGTSTWIAGGGISLSQLRRDTALTLPRRSEPLAVWFARVRKKQPRVGDVFRYGNAELVVRKVRRGRVQEFTINRTDGMTPPKIEGTNL